MLEILATWIINVISVIGYWGIFILMTLESALIPIPSEVTMPFSGFLIFSGKFTLLPVVLSGTMGNLVGSLLAYALGFWGQERVVRQVIKRWGKFLLITEDEFNRAETWFRKYGEVIVFFSRILPVIRTFISLPAGVARMNLFRFSLYTTVGSFLWSLFLTYIGFKLGENWENLGGYFHKFDIFLFLGLILATAWYFYWKLKKLKVINIS